MTVMWKRFKAYWRIDLKAVCEMSKDGRDYHDWPDSVEAFPFHMADLTCKRCGKKFGI